MSKEANRSDTHKRYHCIITNCYQHPVDLLRSPLNSCSYSYVLERGRLKKPAVKLQLGLSAIRYFLCPTQGQATRMGSQSCCRSTDIHNRSHCWHPCYTSSISAGYLAVRGVQVYQLCPIRLARGAGASPIATSVVHQERRVLSPRTIEFHFCIISCDLVWKGF